MQPTIIEDTQSIAANSTVENVIVSNASLRGLLQTPYPCRIRLLAVQSAAGLRLDALHSSKLFVANSDVRVATFAEDPLDLINGDAFADRSEQMVLRVTNTTGGALTFRYRLILEPLVGDSWDGMSAVDLPPDTVVMQRSQVITTLQVDVQLLDGLTFERNPVPSRLRVLMTQSAIGLLRTLMVDNDRVAPPSAVSIANRIPQDPFDTTIEGVEVPGDALQQLSVSNPTGGSLTVNWKTKNEYLVRV